MSRLFYLGLESGGRTVWFHLRHWPLFDRARRALWERDIAYRVRWPKP